MTKTLQNTIKIEIKLLYFFIFEECKIKIKQKSRVYNI